MLSMPGIAVTGSPLQSGLVLFSSRNSVTLASVAITSLPVMPDPSLTSVNAAGSSK